MLTRFGSIQIRFYSKKYVGSSKSWLQRQKSDQFVKRAHNENFRCRSAFKLMEIDEKYDLLKPGQIVIDCGCAPGSWSQVVIKKCDDLSWERSTIVGIDLLDVSPIDGVTILDRCDFTAQETQAKVMELLSGRKADLVLSDMAPNVTRIKDLDHDRIIELCSSVVKFSMVVLKDGGSVLCKIWMGAKQPLLQNGMEKLFSSVKCIKPKSSRSESAECYLLGRDFKGVRNENG